MNNIKKLLRLIYINYIFFKYGLDNFIWSAPNFKLKKILILFFPWRWFKKHERPQGTAVREALESLGPIFVKFGQLLSTRQDLLPENIANELSKLQDNVPPFSSVIAKETIEKSLQQSVETVFKTFELTPMASASIAQVHHATLFDDKEVAVKVLRPNIKKQILQDVALLETMAAILSRISSFKRLQPVAVVQEIKSTLLDEIDLLKEAANASQLRRNFPGNGILYVPEIHWDYCRKDVMVLEKIDGVRISDIDVLEAHNVDLKKLAERGVEIFFTQVFRDCFFHADMHPGNIFVDVSLPANPSYIAVDFGIMGTLNPADQRYLAENFLAFFKRNYRQVAMLHIESGWVPKNTSVSAFESAIRTVCEPIFEKPLKHISFAQTLLRLFQVAKRFNMEIQPQLLLLQKTLVSVEGLGRQLYPDLDLWNTAKPFLEQWMKTHYSPKRLFKEAKYKLPHLTSNLLHMPNTLHDALEYWQLQLQPHLEQSRTKAPKKNHLSIRTISTISLGCTLILSSTILLVHTLSQATLEQWGLPIALFTALLGLVLAKKKVN